MLIELLKIVNLISIDTNKKAGSEPPAKPK